MARPKTEVSYDVEAVKEYVNKYFMLENEIRGLREEKKNLSDEFKGKVDLKLVTNVIRLVKAQLKMTASEETVEELSNIIKEKIGAVLE